MEYELCNEYLKTFSIGYIEKVFKDRGNLQEGSFCIFKKVYSDESSSLWLDAPTDFTEKDCQALEEKVLMSMSIG